MDDRHRHCPGLGQLRPAVLLAFPRHASSIPHGAGFFSSAARKAVFGAGSEFYGAGVDANIVTASIKALLGGNKFRG
ncbi:hypothetical protein ACCAA_130063 [Candidatus Accumulibacter aalborgensis]|uniref:Uncharacterized protein n=1 Tax=Candidatus Accumulibacter aalborgensis TaxID=1860102 RepID=A0A1A8XI89_9PROT|nr:hypothetical protein ACCAA_130063 [Candidatus Accumulibacter aalborgensis]